MSKVPSENYNRIVAALRRLGFAVVRQRSSHIRLQKQLPDRVIKLTVPALPGCVSEGDTLDEARKNIREAIELYLEPIEEPVPPAGGIVEEIAV